MTNVTVLNGGKKDTPDCREELIKYLEGFIEDVRSRAEPVPECMVLFSTARGKTPKLFATGTQATPMGVLATFDLAREAALMHLTRVQYEGVGDE